MARRGRTSLAWVAALCLSLPFALRGGATDHLHLDCSGPTTCSAASFGIQTTPNSTPSFNIVDVNGGESGTAFLAVVVPNGAASFTVTTGGITTVAVEETLTWNSSTAKLSTLLGENGLTGSTFSSFQDKSQQAGAGTVTSFTVYEFNLGSFNSAGGGASGIGTVAIGGSGLPAGTILYAWVEDAKGHVIDQTPLSEALVTEVHVTADAPEPASLALFGTGFVVLGGAVRRCWHRQV